LLRFACFLNKKVLLFATYWQGYSSVYDNGVDGNHPGAFFTVALNGDKQH